MLEFKQQLQQKGGLTPEAFFRACDVNYEQRVTSAFFKSQLYKFNLQLSRGQMSRLVLILDEDMEGTIGLEEYYDALEAYNCSGEKHHALDGSGRSLHFEHKVLFKLLKVLKERKMTPAELFRSCDVDGAGQVNVKELESVLVGLSSEFRQKDVHVIRNFFDIDKSGHCFEQEFLERLRKVEK